MEHSPSWEANNTLTSQKQLLLSKSYTCGQQLQNWTIQQ
jgi:hypothetical protein